MEYQNTDQFQKMHTRIVTNTGINTVSSTVIYRSMQQNVLYHR